MGDELSWMRGADPVDADALPDGNSVDADVLLAGIMRPPWWRRRRLIWWLVPAALLLIAAGYVLVRAPDDAMHVACYAQARHDAAIRVEAAGDEPPEETCAKLWEELSEPGGPSGSEPLQACVTGAGRVAVVPGDENACGRLGWATLDPADDPERPDARLRAALTERFLEAECLDAEAATALAREVLAELGLDSWSIDSSRPLSAERPCMSFGIDIPEQQIRLIPLGGGALRAP